jgi:hypothetical protein
MLIHQIWRRLAVLTGLCLATALVSAATVAAYPVTPEGEPLYLQNGTPPSSVATVSGSVPRAAEATQQSPTPEPVSATVFASSGTEWGSVIAIAAGAGLVVLAAIAAAFVVTNHRRRSAGAH